MSAEKWEATSSITSVNYWKIQSRLSYKKKRQEYLSEKTTKKLNQQCNIISKFPELLYMWFRIFLFKYIFPSLIYLSFFPSSSCLINHILLNFWIDACIGLSADYRRDIHFEVIEIFYIFLKFRWSKSNENI